MCVCGNNKKEVINLRVGDLEGVRGRGFGESLREGREWVETNVIIF